MSRCHLRLLGHVVGQVDVFDLQIQGEGVVVVSIEDARPSRLPEEAVSGGDADGVPEEAQIQTKSLGCEGGGGSEGVAINSRTYGRTRTVSVRTDPA